MLNRRSFSDVLPESPKSARKKEEARQAEFVRIGQVKKKNKTHKSVYSKFEIPYLCWEQSKNKKKWISREIAQANQNESLFKMYTE